MLVTCATSSEVRRPLCQGHSFFRNVYVKVILFTKHLIEICVDDMHIIQLNVGDRVLKVTHSAEIYLGTILQKTFLPFHSGKPKVNIAIHVC